MKKLILISLIVSMLILSVVLVGCGQPLAGQATMKRTSVTSSPPSIKCIDSDVDVSLKGNDWLTKGRVKSNEYPNSKEDYCRDFNGQTYLIEGRCESNKYIAYQKNCAEIGKDYTCVDGKCVGKVVPVTSSCKDLKDYPSWFVTNGQFNGYYVVGVKASWADSLAMTDIATSMKYTNSKGEELPVSVVDATKLDSEIADVKAQNLIVIGNPCRNTVAAELLGNPKNCLEGFTPGKSNIKLFQNDDKVAMLVGGWQESDDRLAGKVLAHRWKELNGNEVEIEGTTYSDATISAPAKPLYNDGCNIKFVMKLTPPKMNKCTLLPTEYTCTDILLEGETSQYPANLVGSFDQITLKYVDATTVEFDVNGEKTGKLKVNDVYTLKTKATIKVKSILYQGYAGGVHSAEFVLSSN